VLQAVNPVVIGITGSYGKTSTKEILYHILSTRYDTLRTPRSFNTLMGVCKVIREELKPQHRFFIVEMGAYKSGEIEKICRLVRPKYGILTAVGPQHLERFKTVEAVAKAKNELILALPPDGTGIFNADNPYCRRLAHEAPVKALCYAMEDGQEADLRAESVAISNDGTRFDVVSRPGGERYPAKTALLGRYNVSNSLAAVLAARECGFTIKEALLALSTAAPFSHRLQPVQTDAGIYTIDDSYNSNPLGAQMALELLASFPQGQKVLVTPGYAELGAIQAEEHEKLGRLAGQTCDYVFLIGGEARTGEIKKGLLQTAIDPGRVLCYNSLSQAKERLATLLKPGDVVLFENDLPDQYL
jgi:UDP-N-acetylmuramoyl-tripeptide--D-alanyl-D-alanine ligase